jgi:thymidine kinase
MATSSRGGAEFFLGPMFSEKTTTVARHLSRARLAGLATVLVKHARDTRYGADEAVYTHDGARIASLGPSSARGRLRVVAASRLLDVELGADELYIGVDEGQFFPDLRAALDGWIREGRRVYVAALDGDFRREAFAPVAEALPLASSVAKLSAVCMLCAAQNRRPAKAPYTIRITAETDVEVVGSADKYRAVCLDCYHAATATRPGGG